MVPVRCGAKGVPARVLFEVFMHRVGCTQGLECTLPETGGFILEVKLFDTQAFCQPGKAYQRGRFVFPDLAVIGKGILVFEHRIEISVQFDPGSVLRREIIMTGRRHKKLPYNSEFK
jgi:hypothetical protein